MSRVGAGAAGEEGGDATDGAAVPGAGDAEAIYWRRLEAGLRAGIESFAGVAGICLLDVRGGRRLDINADLSFGTASSIKVAILSTLLRRLEQGELSFGERRTISPAEHVGGSGVLQTCADPVELSVRDLCRLMIAYSDNTATNVCIDLAGGFAAVNRLFDDLGLHRTRLMRKMMDRDAVARGEQNISTPAEMATLMRLLAADQRVLAPEAEAAAVEILCLPKDSPFSLLARPDMRVADKPGHMTGIRCDVGFFFQPRRPFALAIMTSYGDDGDAAESWLRATATRVVGAMAMLDAVFDGRSRAGGESS